jgi:hypothetical protein
MTKFKVEAFSDYLKNTIGDIESGKITDYAISTMNLFARPDSLVEKFLDCLLKRKFKVYYDETLSDRVYILPDGHYVFKILPRGKKKNHYKNQSDEISNQNRQNYADILVGLKPRFSQIKSNSSWWRKLGSFHLLQSLGTSHFKVATSVWRDGSRSVTVATGELSSESQQNNLSLTFQSDKAYSFAKKLMNPNYQIGEKLFETCAVSSKLWLVADYGNYGQPSVLPEIHRLAQELISDKPKSVLFVSQYNPSSRILRALNKASRRGANVTVPMQPANDYRRNDSGFKLLFAKFKLVVSRKINLPVRQHPSHVKCLIVQHLDNSLSMIFGSDNLESWADTFYRNTELAVVIKHAQKTDDEFKIVQQMLDLFVETNEISKAERALYKKS